MQGARNAGLGGIARLIECGGHEAWGDIVEIATGVETPPDARSVRIIVIGG